MVRKYNKMQYHCSIQLLIRDCIFIYSRSKLHANYRALRNSIVTINYILKTISNEEIFGFIAKIRRFSFYPFPE